MVFILNNIGDYHSARLAAVADRMAKQELTILAIEASHTSHFYSHAQTRAQTMRERFSQQRLTGNSRIGRAISLVLALVRTRPKFVFTIGYNDDLALIALVYAYLFAVKAFFLADSKADDQPRSRATEFVKRRIVRRFDGALVAGRRHKAYFRSLGVNGPIEIGYDVIDNVFFAGRADALGKHRKLLERAGLPRIGYVVCVSRLVHRKRIDRALAIWERSGAPDRGVGFLLVGAGPLEGDVQRMIASCERPDLVTHCRGIRNSLMPGIYAGAEALILASDYDQWGLSVNEAMSVGVPAIVSARCGVANEIVIPGVNGYVFDGDDIAPAASALAQWMDESDLRMRLSSAAVETMSHWTLETFAESCVKLVNEVIEERRK